MSVETHHGEAGERTVETHIQLPAPTFWPMIFAFGLTLLFAGMVTYWVVSVVGFVLAFRAALGWWWNVIPHEEHEEVAIDPRHRPAPILVEHRSVIRLKAGERGHRMRIPVEVHPYSSGVKGGLVGAAAMAILASLYGLIAQHSIWYPVNLLAGVVIPGLGTESVQQLRQFQGLPFTAAFIGHVGLSILVGIVYAAILPMFPKYAPLWAGVIVPLFWSGLTATTLNVLNPPLNARISWPWFVVCQLAFGLTGGYVIARSERIHTMQSVPFAQRAAFHYPSDHTEQH